MTLARMCVVIATFGAATLLLSGRSDAADEPYYKGKTVTVFVGASPGGTNDIVARLIARHIARHFPGTPTVIAKNLPGAGGRKLAGHLFTRAPKDGTEFGVVNRSLFTEAVLKVDNNEAVDYRRLTWVGSPVQETLTCVSWHTSPVQSLEDLRTKEFIIAATGGGTASGEVIASNVLNAFLGSKVKAITGYPGGSEMYLAMQRGEVDGRCAIGWGGIKAAHRDLITSGQMKVLIQTSLEGHPDLAGIPVLYDLATAEAEKQILYLLLVDQKVGRPFVAPPEMPAGRKADLQNAFGAALLDADLKAEAERLKLDVAPVSGQSIDGMLTRLDGFSPDAVARARQIVGY